MGKALYRSNRPKKLADVVGQEHITTALERALKKGTISHAYLFTGPRGVGKTTTARILAHEINNLPYEDDTNHLDIIEIDAASNRRIDEIRDLRDKVHIAPTSAKYKVYIIDEVHMLTKEAFNALLKTLEEPPEHVVFILATTEVHKLPETIISRTQRFAFKPGAPTTVTGHLKNIAKAEGITIDDDALALIAEHGGGSFRDSISLLDQLRNSGDKVGLEEVRRTLGIPPTELVEQLLAAVVAHDAPAVTTHLGAFQLQGYEPAQVARQLAALLTAQLVAKQLALPHEHGIALLTKLVAVPASHDPRTYLEIALLDTALAGTPAATPVDKPAPPKVMSEKVQSVAPVQIEPHPSTLRKPKAPEPIAETAAEVEDNKPRSTEVLDASLWPKVLADIKRKHNTLYSIIRTARPHFEAGTVTLESGFAFHQKRLNEARNKSVVAETIEALSGQSVQIQCTLGQGKAEDDIEPVRAELPPEDEAVVHTVAAPEKPVEQPGNETIKNVSNIFGSAELLES